MKYLSPIRKAAALTILLALASAHSAGSSNMPLPPPNSMSSIKQADLKTHLSFLASDELGGRYTFSPSLRVAADYLASQLKSYGYRGGARDGTFLQNVPLGYRGVDSEKSDIVLTGSSFKKRLKYGEDFLSQQDFDASVSGELVFAGYGISSPSNKHDDYAGLDVKGKIVVIAGGAPEQLKAARIPEGERGAEAAYARGAKAVISIPSQRVLQAWSATREYLSRGRLGIVQPSARNFPVVMAGSVLIKLIATALGKEEAYLRKPEGKPLEPAKLPLSAEVRVDVTVKELPPTHNVVAVLEGSDPKLKNEYVVVSAHYDHLETSSSGEVYNGADDDGSGTSAVLEIAQAFATGPRSKRSVLVILHTAEELGLFGSEFYTDYDPVVPLDRLVANLNIDMIGRSRLPGNSDSRDRDLSDPNTVYLIGADKLSTELNRVSEKTNADTVAMNLDYKYNEDHDPERFYYRSDHYNYARHGIPIIFYFTGPHRDYHRSSDDLDKIDFEKMERITKLIFATGWRIANLPDRPPVDKKPAEDDTLK
ncbi:MAG TPA: M28 family peptidase [Blastocatellia bacterium]|nr:M28 family peptidase [Blastocatellia bacterium]